MTNPWVLFFDGAMPRIKGKPTASVGFVIYTPDGHLHKSGNGLAHWCKTTNQSEYAALIYGLQQFVNDDLNVPILCKGDSMLVVEQVNGRWRVKQPELERCRSTAVTMLESINRDWRLIWIPREQNQEADALSKQRPMGERPPVVYRAQEHYKESRQGTGSLGIW